MLLVQGQQFESQSPQTAVYMGLMLSTQLSKAMRVLSIIEAGYVGFVTVRKKHWFCYILKETLGPMGWPGCQYWFFGNILGT